MHKYGKSMVEPKLVAPPADWQGDPRHYPKVPDHVDLLRVEEANGKVKVLARCLLPYEARAFLEQKITGDDLKQTALFPENDAYRYEVASCDKYKDGETF